MVVSFANVNGLCFLAENVNVKIDDDDLTELLTAPYCCVIEGRQAVNEGEGAFRLVCGDKPSQAAPCSFFIFLLLGGKVLPSYLKDRLLEDRLRLRDNSKLFTLARDGATGSAEGRKPPTSSQINSCSRRRCKCSSSKLKSKEP